jgi:hypothetical protein
MTLTNALRSSRWKPSSIRHASTYSGWEIDIVHSRISPFDSGLGHKLKPKLFIVPSDINIRYRLPSSDSGSHQHPRVQATVRINDTRTKQGNTVNVNGNYTSANTIGSSVLTSTSSSRNSPGSCAMMALMFRRLREATVEYTLQYAFTAY